MVRQRRAASSEKFRLTLYIAGESDHSLRAKANLEEICKEFLGDNYDLEIIDIIEDPRRALDDGVIVTPTLYKISPEPKIKAVGDLSDAVSIRVALGIGKK